MPRRMEANTGRWSSLTANGGYRSMRSTAIAGGISADYDDYNLINRDYYTSPVREF